jgi:hypothetical protein
MDNWECKVINKNSPTALEQELNTLGAEGWEVVSMSQHVGSYTVLLKRRKQ